MIGIPRHLKVERGTACGLTRAWLITEDAQKVECLRCRRTEVFRREKMIAKRMEAK